MTDTGMIERVMKAIEAAPVYPTRQEGLFVTVRDFLEEGVETDDYKELDIPEGEFWEIAQAICSAAARAAIEAMYWPNEKMLGDNTDAVVGCCCMSKTDKGNIWQAMISAALEE